MVNIKVDYNDKYDYGTVIHRRKSKQLNKFRLTIGSVLIGLSFFMPYFLLQDGNGGITAILWVVSVVLFKQIDWRKLFV